MTENREEQERTSAAAGQSGRTSPDASRRTAATTSRQSSRNSSESQNRMLPMCLCLRKTSGPTQDCSTMSWDSGAWPGESTTVNFGESPSVVRESTLSQILDLNAPEKYCLSPRACAGILRRAEKRGKTLPDMLRDALMEVVGSDGCDCY